jgi:hypothetical protein
MKDSVTNTDDKKLETKVGQRQFLIPDLFI